MGRGQCCLIVCEYITVFVRGVLYNLHFVQNTHTHSCVPVESECRIGPRGVLVPPVKPNQGPDPPPFNPLQSSAFSVSYGSGWSRLTIVVMRMPGVGASAITFKSVRIVIDLRDFLQPEYWLILGRTTRHHDTRFLLAQGINQMHKFNEFPKRLLKLIYLACEAAGLQKIENTIRDGGSIALCTAYTVIICNQNIASTSVFS